MQAKFLLVAAFTDLWPPFSYCDIWFDRVIGSFKLNKTWWKCSPKKVLSIQRKIFFMWPLFWPRSNVVNSSKLSGHDPFGKFCMSDSGHFWWKCSVWKVVSSGGRKNSKWPLLWPRPYLLHKAARSNSSGPTHSLGLKLGRTEGNTKDYHFTEYFLKWPPWWPVNENNV